MGKRKRKHTPQRLAPLPFDPVKIKHIHGSDALKQKGNDYYFQKKTFHNGMLIQTVHSIHTLDRVLNPPFHEIKPFISAGFVTPAAALAMTYGQVVASIRPGDNVDVIAGEQAGYKAMVVSCNEDVAVVDLQSSEPKQVAVDQSPFLLTVPLRHIRRRLQIGDNVCVREDAGENAGSSGCVVAVSDDGQHLTFVEDQTRNHVSARVRLEISKIIYGNRSTSSPYLSGHARPSITMENRLMLSLNPTQSISVLSSADASFCAVNIKSKDMSDTFDLSPQALPASSWRPTTI
jgi:transcription elongation factor